MFRPALDRRGFLGAAGAAVLGSRALADDRSADDDKSRPATLIGLDDADAERVRTTVFAFLDAYNVPGAAIALTRNGRLGVAGGFGYADVDRNEPASPDHLFRVASVSKPITAVAVMMLVDEGRIDLQDRVFGEDALLARYYDPASLDDAEQRRRVEAVTVARLLEHTCGGWRNNEEDPMFARDALHLDHAGLIGWVLRNRPLTADPGTEYNYSNFGYCLLGRVIEEVSGASYEEFVRDHVLAACGISRMRIGGDSLCERHPAEVVYYGQDEDPYGPAMRVRRMDAHGGWIASPVDLVRFAVHVDGFPAPDDLLSRNALATMTEPSEPNRNYAMGWAVNERENWWHLGAFNGAASLLVRTSDRWCWAIVVNSRSRKPDFLRDLDRLGWQIRQAIASWPDVDRFAEFD